jgi:hypothetical protein
LGRFKQPASGVAGAATGSAVSGSFFDFFCVDGAAQRDRNPVSPGARRFDNTRRVRLGRVEPTIGLSKNHSLVLANLHIGLIQMH